MTRTAPDGSPLPRRKHVAHFLDTLRWAGVTLAAELGKGVKLYECPDGVWRVME